MTLLPPQIAKTLIQQRFDKACRSYTTHNQIQQQVATHLLKLLAQASEVPATLLDLGCGPGPNWDALQQRAHTYLGVDLSHAMLSSHSVHADKGAGTHSRLIQADMECLPLATASVDLVYSSMAVQWASSREQLLEELGRVLKPGASAVLSMPLEGSLQPLAGIRQMIDQQAQVNPQPPLEQWTAAVEVSPQLRLEQSEQRRFSQYFHSLKDLLHSIKGVGAGASNASPLTQTTLRALAEHYESHRSTARLPLHYEVGFVRFSRV